MSDELFLRQQIRSAIEKGDLPHRLPDRPGGQPATGARCAACRRPTTDGEHKLLYPIGLRVHMYYMHPACYRVFQEEISRLTTPDSSSCLGDPC